MNGVHPESQSRSHGSGCSAKGRWLRSVRSAVAVIYPWHVVLGSLCRAFGYVPCCVWSLIRKCEPWNRYIDFLANSPRVLDGRGKDGRPGAEPQLVDEPLRLSSSRPQAIAKIGARARLERLPTKHVFSLSLMAKPAPLLDLRRI